MGLHVRAVSVFVKKSDAVCGFFGVFLCGFAVFGPPLRPPPIKNSNHFMASGSKQCYVFHSSNYSDATKGDEQ